MFLCGLMFRLMLWSQMETAKPFGCLTTKAKKITVQPVPKPRASAWDKAFRKFYCQWPMAGASDILAKLPFVRREDADAPPPARNSHIPLLRVRCRLGRRIGKQDVIHGFAL
jgi:hypothetical protein